MRLSTQTPALPVRAPEVPAPGAPVRVVMNGNRLDIQASVDLDGLKKLRTMLEKYESILEMMDPNAPDNVFK